MKVIDITEKLNFEEKPRIKIRDVEITINNSAETVLKIMPLLNKSKKESILEINILEVISLLIPGKDDREKLSKLNLSFEDFTIFIESAITLIVGDNSEGEVQTRTTT